MSVIEFKCVRKHTRYKTDQDIDLYISLSSSFKKGVNIKSKLKDISESGMGLFSYNPIDSDEQIMIDVFFGSTRITTSGKTVYCKEVNEGYMIGIEVDENIKAIMEFMKAKDINFIRV